MSSPEFVQLVVQLAVLLGTAVLCGQALRALRQPAVLGEMIGGVVLGPTILGALAPAVHGAVFHSSAGVTTARDALTRLGMLFFLFVAGLETDVSDLRRRGSQAVYLGLAGTLVPLLAGIALVQSLPAGFWRPGAAELPLAFTLFVGLNLANSAIPVLARTLRDLGYLNGRIGTICMAAAIVDDLVTWACAGLVLSRLAAPAAGSVPVTGPAGLLVLLLVAGGARWLGPHLLRRARSQLEPSGQLAVTTVALLAAAATAASLGTHAFLGAFLLGVALSRSDAEHQQAKDPITRFALGFFAPIYFVSLGLTTNFVHSFDLALVVLVLVTAILSKVAGVLLGTRLAGLALDREAWAIAFGLNARGATGLVLAGVGREAGLIDERVFVALATMAFLTSLMAGPAMRFLLSGRLTLPPATGSPSGDDGGEAKGAVSQG